MAENIQPNAAPANAGQGQFGIQKIYVKDVSLETPNTPQLFMEQTPPSQPPNVNYQLTSSSQGLAQNLFEVTLSVTVTVTISGKTAFLVEVQQSGIFTIQGFPQDRIGYLLGSYCPTILYPYLRETVSDLVIRSGFPPLLLEPVNFDAMYAQHLQQQAGQVSTTAA